jgi:uncharacterized membrane protein YcaP (DUF421 family)
MKRPPGFNLQHIFLGDLTWALLLELAFRTVFIFVFALLAFRWIGKRGIGQFTPFEYVLIVAMGSAVGDPIEDTDFPLLQAMLIITLMVMLQRWLVRLTEFNTRFEGFVEGHTTCLVCEGQVDQKALHKEGLSIGELYEALRGAGIEHLGQVKRAYLEPSGKVSVFTFPPSEVRQGLSLLLEATPQGGFSRGSG